MRQPVHRLRPRRNSYDPYGKPKIQTGTWNNTYGTPHATLGWANEYVDTDSSYVYLRARHYDPNTAQFLQTDPIPGGSCNTHEYVCANPLTGTDPAGQQAKIAGPLNSQYTDTGLTYLRARRHDPATAQFLQTDPVPGGSCNTHEYVCANPLGATDPSGAAKGGRKNLRPTGDTGGLSVEEQAALDAAARGEIRPDQKAALNRAQRKRNQQQKADRNRRNSGGDGRGTQTAACSLDALHENTILAQDNQTDAILPDLLNPNLVPVTNSSGRIISFELSEEARAALTRSVAAGLLAVAAAIWLEIA